MCKYLAIAFCMVVGFVGAARGEEAGPVLLWPEGAPGAKGVSEEDKPAVYVRLPKGEKRTGCAVLVCPGGGFETRCIDQEGVVVANWLNERGIAAFILRYRIRPIYTTREALRDAQRAVQFIRAHADEYGVAKERVGVIGFSAGAELASMLSLNTVAGQDGAADVLDRFSTRPDFQILVYGSSPAGNEADVSKAPPTFMFCTAEDAGHLAGMLGLYTRLRQARVPVEVHFFPHGEHGVGMAPGDPVLGQWPGLLHTWMRAHKFLVEGERVGARGVVKIDGEALPHGSVVFTPVGNEDAPAVTAYVLNTGEVRGEYRIPASRGLVPGKYRVEVRQDAGRWLSNSRNPLRLEMVQKQRAGTLTEEDRKKWEAYVRERDLSPSIDGVRVYRKKRAGDAEEMFVEIKAGEENRNDIEAYTK